MWPEHHVISSLLYPPQVPPPLPPRVPACWPKVSLWSLPAHHVFTRRCWKRTSSSSPAPWLDPAPLPRVLPPWRWGWSWRAPVWQVMGSFRSMIQDHQSCLPPPQLRRAGDHRYQDQSLKVRNPSKCVCVCVRVYPLLDRKTTVTRFSRSPTEARPSAAAGWAFKAALTSSGQAAPPSPTLQTTSS